MKLELNKKAFTLIELLVVIAIIGILSGLIVVSMNGATNSANDAKRKANIDTIRKALIIYGTLNGMELLPNLPTDPISGTYYKYFSNDGTYFTLSATLSDSTLFYNNQSGYTTFTCGSNVSYSGVTYNTVLIGNQCWFKQNLNVGTLTAGTNNQGSSCTSIQKYCYSNLEANCTSDGGLYQWNQAMCGSTAPRAQGICPAGWHIPSHNDWTTLERAINGSTAFPYDTTTTGWLGTTEGASLKEAGTDHWNTGNTGTNTSNFTALGAGYRRNTSDGAFDDRLASTRLWSSLESGGSAWRRSLEDAEPRVTRSANSKEFGFSVRCLKD
jgi:uncharacterized protein (TIGR02145 family)/prepilin-type N-terminal cleavage/methylation domain-containing protein